MLPNYKDIVDLIKKGSTIEAQEKILELREAAMELQEENLALRAKVKSLEEQAELRQKVTWEKPYYWVKSGSEKDGPYCQKCFDQDSKLIRLQGGKNGTWGCHVCKTVVYDSSYQAPQVHRSPPSDWRVR